MKPLKALRSAIRLASLTVGAFPICFFVQTFGVNVPVEDDTDHLNTGLAWKANGIDLQSLLALHNEHCLAVPGIWNHLMLVSTGGDSRPTTTRQSDNAVGTPIGKALLFQSEDARNAHVSAFSIKPVTKLERSRRWVSLHPQTRHFGPERR